MRSFVSEDERDMKMETLEDNLRSLKEERTFLSPRKKEKRGFYGRLWSSSLSSSLAGLGSPHHVHIFGGNLRSFMPWIFLHKSW